ncbi:sensor histidine kinase [Actinoplanes sp. RD1]|uniref:sensor histidine kinase n=1 Tax=Actinoplanes sp. RD1 TaxID=3064538 RepID=UPI002741E272|nr:HAMP domain-containing sensor histidine kinase [Actinoplanes sp. RD1]
MRRLGLRARVTAAFAVGALALSACVTLVSYELTRRTLAQERESTAVRAAYFDAAVVDSGLAGSDPDVLALLRSLDTGADRDALLQWHGRWYSLTADLPVRAAVPPPLQALAQRGEAGAQRIHRDGTAMLVVAVPLSASAVLYELVSLRELERTLQLLALVLLVVAVLVAGGGAAVGWYVTRHSLRPLTAVVATARDLAGGNLDARMDPHTEPELAQLSASFNHMADELSRRMARDRRFAADVSHELRSPLQTLSAAASVVERRREGLDERSAEALGMITEEIARFQALVDDLIELARSDQPAHREATDIAELARKVLRRYGLTAGLVEVLPGTAGDWHVDRRRIEQALGNLVDNAQRYGGGVTAVRVGPCFVEVDDAGPGVPADQREIIFDRFVRGAAANGRGDSDGTGLGLSIVAQHAAAHEGRASVSDRPGGGARFRIDLSGCA